MVWHNICWFSIENSVRNAGGNNHADIASGHLSGNDQQGKEVRYLGQADATAKRGAGDPVSPADDQEHWKFSTALKEYFSQSR